MLTGWSCLVQIWTFVKDWTAEEANYTSSNPWDNCPYIFHMVRGVIYIWIRRRKSRKGKFHSEWKFYFCVFKRTEVKGERGGRLTQRSILCCSKLRLYHLFNKQLLTFLDYTSPPPLPYICSPSSILSLTAAVLTIQFWTTVSRKDRPAGALHLNAPSSVHRVPFKANYLWRAFQNLIEN